MRDQEEARATLHLLATGLATRTGCIHLVARDGTAAMFDPFQGGRAEFATMLLREYLALPDDADVRVAVSESREELASSEDTGLTLWEVPLFDLGLLAMTPRCAGTQKPPVGLTVESGPASEPPAYEFACSVLDRCFGEVNYMHSGRAADGSSTLAVGVSDVPKAERAVSGMRQYSD